MLQSENVMSFSDLARSLPKVNGRQINQSTIWRWALKGCRGVRLETMKLGARYLSSLDAVERYGKAVAEASAAHLAERQAQREQSARAMSVSATRVTPNPSSTLRRKQIERTHRELDKAGIR